MSGARTIRLLLADVDETLLTKDKVLTGAAKEAARELRHAGIVFAITSGLCRRAPLPIATRTRAARFIMVASWLTTTRQLVPWFKVSAIRLGCRGIS